MSLLRDFALYNLLPALVVGAVAWAAIWIGIQALGIRHGKLRLCLLGAPLLKSTLVLLGIGLALPWPRDIFEAWHARAVAPMTVLPVFLILTGAVFLLHRALAARARERALRYARPAGQASTRLETALDNVMESYADNSGLIEARCGCEPSVSRPELLLADHGLRSPLVATAGNPAIVFPSTLVDRLSDEELQGALAHEIAHLQLRSPASCMSAESVRALAAVNPMASVMASQLLREEEKACDDMAVAATGESDVYAGMLLKTYRFASDTTGPLVGSLQYLPQLLGFKPILSERIERLLQQNSPDSGMPRQYAGFVGLWVLIVLVFFTS